MVAPPSLLAVSGAIGALFLIRKEFQYAADHVQLAPSQLLALCPVDDDVPDMNGGRGSPSAALWRRDRLRTICIRHTSHHLVDAPVVRRTRQTQGKASAPTGILPRHACWFGSRRGRPLR